MQDSSQTEEQFSSFDSESPGRRPVSMTFPLVILFMLIAIVIIRCAWVCDDAYISFRTIDNFVNGYGLRWNVDERVQGFTNPLWVLLLSLPYAITHEMYYTSIVVSIVLTLLAVWLIHRTLSGSLFASIIAMMALFMSRAFVDYSTSGLEQPLLFVLAVLFARQYSRYDGSSGQFGWLCLIASLSAVTRLDTLLVYLPALAIALRAVPLRTAIMRGLAGFAPLIVWELFSIVYYGFPFPNTYYAKLHAGIPDTEMYKQGFIYVLDSLSSDPVTLLTMATAVVLAFHAKEKSTRGLAVGMLLYLCYIVSVGGDFMSGRFFALPMVMAAAILAHVVEDEKFAIMSLVIVCSVGLVSPYPNLMSDSRFGTKGNDAVKPTGIADERGWYYQSTGLLRSRHFVEMPAHKWADQGRLYQLSKPAVAYEGCVGFSGFYAGPSVHMFDGFSLNDPLLARLPAGRDPEWRIGHLSRTPPFGYFKTLEQGKNVLKDTGVSQYYDRLCIIKSGPLFTRERWSAIANMNIGAYDYLLNNYWDTTSLAIDYDSFNLARAAGTAWDAPGNLILRRGGVVIIFDTVLNMSALEISSDHNDSYAVVFYRDSEALGRTQVPKGMTPLGGLRLDTLDVPESAKGLGWSKVHIFPVYGDDAYSIGHVRFINKQTIE